MPPCNEGHCIFHCTQYQHHLSTETCIMEYLNKMQMPVRCTGCNFIHQEWCVGQQLTMSSNLSPLHSTEAFLLVGTTCHFLQLTVAIQAYTFSLNSEQYVRLTSIDDPFVSITILWHILDCRIPPKHLTSHCFLVEDKQSDVEVSFRRHTFSKKLAHRSRRHLCIKFSNMLQQCIILCAL